MKMLKLSGLLFITCVIWLAVRQYFFCPRLSFSEPHAFTGSKLYNPYESIDSNDWIKCNFHAHTDAWNSLTNGHGTAEDVWRIYDSLGYSVHCVSEYHKINDSFSQRKNYLPAYEHGYNIRKTHQLVLGSNNVEWLDYLFPQSRSNKQWMLTKLTQNKNNVVILAHPALRNGYSIEDMKYLDDYHCMEVLNPVKSSFSHWDAALSAGKPVFIVGNDDVHDVFKSQRTGRLCTWLNVASVNRANILGALKTGRGYAMKVAEIPGERAQDRIERLKNRLPCLNYFRLREDTILFAVSRKAKEIAITGQEGRLLASFRDTAGAFYALQQNDTYARAAVRFDDGTEIFLNPVFRYTGSPVERKEGFMVDVNQTNFLFLTGLLLLSCWGALCIGILFGPYLFRMRLRARWPRLSRKPYPALDSI